jgi:hypothetical protein
MINTILRNDYVDLNCFITVQCDNYEYGMYSVTTNNGEYKGFVKLLDISLDDLAKGNYKNYKTENRLEIWYDKKTKRYKTQRNKQWNRMQLWFSCLVIESLKKHKLSQV